MTLQGGLLESSHRGGSWPVPWHITEGDVLLVGDGAGGTEGLKWLS